MELKLLLLFAGSLLACVAGGVSVFYALVFGFFLFYAYGRRQGKSRVEMLKLAASGIRTVKNILITFLFIGMITALWRACGTIPYIVYHAAKLCSPSVMVLAAFLLCCLLSLLTGTALGTAATVGVICMTMANGMGIPPVLTGGAILAGSYFGDRSSPMSTSALLVSDLTGTDIYRNLANMFKSCRLPFALTCLFYALSGLGWRSAAAEAGAEQIFARCFRLHPAVLLPAAVIVVFSLLRIRVRLAMGVSILAAAVLAVLVQDISVPELLHDAVFGFYPEDAELAALLSGGGILSMAKVFCIVCLSSCYAGMFDGTGFLEGIRRILSRMSKKLSPFGCVLLTSLVTAMITCNQSLAIMLTRQLCGDLCRDPEKLALDLEDTAVVLAPLIPWSVAAVTPLHAVGAPTVSIAAACYLYLLPLCRLAGNFLPGIDRKARRRYT